MHPAPSAPRRTTSESTRPSRGKRLLFGAIVTVTMLGVLELGARAIEAVRPPRPVDFGAGFEPGSRVLVPTRLDARFVETATAKLKNFVNQRVEVRKPRGTLRIAAVGGSCLYYLDDDFRVLERELLAAVAPRWERVEVMNFGGRSYGSHRLVTVVAEALGYDPDIVLYYEAHNEFEDDEQRRRAALENVEVQRTASRSAVFRLVRDLTTPEAETQPAARRPADGTVTDVRPDSLRAWYTIRTRADVDDRMEQFEANLRSIASSCRARNVPFVLATVPSNLVNPGGPALMRAYGGVRELLAKERYAEGAALGRRILAESLGRHQSSDVENGIIRRVAASFELPLADIEAVICAAEPHHVPGETLFSDHCHFTPRGRELVRAEFAEVLADVLRRSGD